MKQTKNSFMSKGVTIKKRTLYISIIVIAVLVVAGLGISQFILSEPSTDDSDLKESEITDNKEEASDEVFATVNDEEITEQEVSEMQDSSAQQGAEMSEKNALEQLIDQKLLLQEAKSEGFNVTEEEAKQFIEKELEKQGTSLEEYKSSLEQMPGTTYEEVLDDLKDQILIQNYIDAQTENVEETTDQEIEEYRGLLENQTPDEEYSDEEVKEFVKQQKATQQMQLLIQELKEKANIEYLKEPETETEEGNQQEQEIPIEVE